MPQLTIEQMGTFAVPSDKRLVLAMIDEAGTDQLHSCGGNARCTTCRVQFISGEPTQMTQAEQVLLASSGLDKMAGVRLSCQLLCQQDMTVRMISHFAGSGKKDAGKRPDDQIMPPPVWQGK